MARKEEQTVQKLEVARVHYGSVSGSDWLEYRKRRDRSLSRQPSD